MALPVDYLTLTEYVVSVFDRSADTAFTDQRDAFIGLAEDSWTPQLLSRRMEATTTLTTATDGSIALPADFYRYRALYALINGVNTNLPMVGPTAEQGLYPISTGDTANFAKIVGNTLYVIPEQAMGVTLDYWQKFVGLSGSNTTNWIILNHPTLYVYAMMAQACLFLQDWQTAAAFDAKAQAVLDTIMDKFGLDYYQNTDLVLDSPTP